MKFSTKRILCMLVSVCMVIALIPCTAIAGEIWGELPTRIAGATRFTTSALISENTPHADDPNAIVIVDGMNFPDALAATVFAYNEDAPILMVNGVTGAIDQSVIDEINRLDSDHNAYIYVIGGEIAVSPKAVDALKNIGYKNIERIYGKSRFETAVKLAESVDEVSTVYIADGMNYPDALGIGSAAAVNNGVILFTQKNSLPAATKEYLETASFDNIVIIGGTSAISEQVENQLKEICSDVSRISGMDRVSTSVKIAETYFPTTDVIFVATGFNFADALAGGPLAAQYNAPILLLNTVKGEISPDTIQYIKNSGAKKIVVFGGVNAVNVGIFNKLMDLVGGEKEQLFAKQDFSIVLPADHSDLSEGLEEYGIFIFANDDSTAFIQRDDFDTLKEADMNPNTMTLSDYAILCMIVNEVSSPVLEKYGLTYFVYTIEDEYENEDLCVYSFVKKGSDAFYLIQFMCLSSDEAIYQREFFRWATSITLK